MPTAPHKRKHNHLITTAVVINKLITEEETVKTFLVYKRVRNSFSFDFVAHEVFN